MANGDKSIDARKRLRDRLDQLVAKREALERRISAAQVQIGEVDKNITALRSQLALAHKVQGELSPALGKVTLKNADLQEVWIILQIAFRGPKGPWYDPELQRSFEQRELYAHLIRAGKKVNESTFRTYLRRLREKNLIWKHNGRWRLAKNGRAEVEQKDLEVKPEE
jgi:hypothetical protein